MLDSKYKQLKSNVEYLQEINLGFQFLLTRHINQDIVEHTFGEIRNLSGN